MRDEWVGDIGDLGKYGLLRVLTGYPDAPEGNRLRLGVIWYYNPDVLDTGLDAKIKGSWGDLYRKLQELRHSERRTVAHVQQSDILTPKTSYYRAPVDRKFNSRQRVQYEYHGARYAWNVAPDDWLDDWLNGALHCTAKAELVLLDPDNGIAGQRSGNRTDLKPWHQDGPKYTFISDIQSFLRAGKSLVIYHHLGRNASKDSQIGDLSKNLERILDTKQPPQLRALWFHPERAFFVIAQKNHKALLWDRLDSLLNGDWGNLTNPRYEEIPLP